MPDLNTVAQAGLAAFRRGDHAAARAAFAQVADAGKATPRLWLLLAQASAATGDDLAADAALDRVLAAEPRHVAALVMKGDRAVDDRAAGSFYALALGSAGEGDRRDPPTAALLAHAERRLAEASARYRTHFRAALADVDAGPRFAEAVAIVAGDSQVYPQAPTNFYFPGLAPRRFWDPAGFAWGRDFAAAAPAIRAELEAVMAGGEGMRPYVQADPARANKGHALLDNADWSAFHLLENGAPVPGQADRCPATMAALGHLPIPRIANRSPMALFSVLKPHTHIPPHNGMLNTRLIVHLPLIVPADCRLRVGNEVRDVVAGVPMIFDDSIEHEAWNDSDETRIVLLTEIWRPDIDDAERAAVTRLFEAIGLYEGGQ